MSGGGNKDLTGGEWGDGGGREEGRDRGERRRKRRKRRRKIRKKIPSWLYPMYVAISNSGPIMRRIKIMQQ